MTVLELLLDYLPEKYVDRIVSNMINRNALHQKADNISAELLTLFDWEASREGFEFWSDVLDAIEDGRKLPPLPIDITYYPNTNLFLEGNEWVVMNTGGLGINIRFEFVPRKVREIKDKKKYEIFLSFVN
jgi:hypothetical protein